MENRLKREVISGLLSHEPCKLKIPICKIKDAHWRHSGITIIRNNQLLSVWISSLLHRTEFIPGTIKLAKSTWLGQFPWRGTYSCYLPKWTGCTNCLLNIFKPLVRAAPTICNRAYLMQRLTNSQNTKNKKLVSS